jgi:Sec-independent protein translocase protein TatA
VLSLGDQSPELLPNFFGINPIEFAIIFGTLYYLFGPTRLYEFTREAGRLFSTYFPVAKEIAGDLVSEFKDYMEEEKEREKLAERGVDLSKLPRRTSNVFERFSDAMEALKEANEDDGLDSSTLSRGLGTPSGLSDLDQFGSMDIPTEDSVISPPKFVPPVAAVAAAKGLQSGAEEQKRSGVGSMGTISAGTGAGASQAEMEVENVRVSPSESRMKGNRRKKKKEVLMERNVDIDKVYQKAHWNGNDPASIALLAAIAIEHT